MHLVYTQRVRRLVSERSATGTRRALTAWPWSVIVLFAALGFTACGGGAEKSATATPEIEAGDATPVARAIPTATQRAAAGSTDEEILAVVWENLRALRAEDLKAAMATLDPDSSVYATTEAFTRDIFQLYDLSYEVSDLRVVSKSGSEARVHFVQVTRRVRGPAFADNQIEGEHFLRLVEGRWFIYATKADSIRYLDAAGSSPEGPPSSPGPSDGGTTSDVYEEEPDEELEDDSFDEGAEESPEDEAPE